MALLDRIKETFGGERSTRQFRYHCRECDTDFESEEQSRTRVACPHCGADGARSISKL